MLNLLIPRNFLLMVLACSCPVLRWWKPTLQQTRLHASKLVPLLLEAELRCKIRIYLQYKGKSVGERSSIQEKEEAVLSAALWPSPLPRQRCLKMMQARAPARAAVGCRRGHWGADRQGCYPHVNLLYHLRILTALRKPLEKTVVIEFPYSDKRSALPQAIKYHTINF